MLSVSECDDSAKLIGNRWIPAFAGMTSTLTSFRGADEPLRADLVPAAVLGAIQRGVCLREQIFRAVDMR